ncbi:TetR/AcrR family transcriptional regulator [Lactococcus fujiensis]|uniref:Transcriptional regulator n=1 Tax=Lactococcus fujiensis JCM 16395 TaxID=1291764 RepID=A0A2A5RKC1_9LACT|nr:TetR/AcrR family transcriptional regulator [Lactococcus fujiensis]PCR99597.1 transcriptional regulator [Lactococcus fujiensis JCM 16395]
MMSEQSLDALYEQTLSQQKDLSEVQKSVLKAALKLFSSQGFEATSTSQIAQEAGVASGSVYKQFKNKRALLAAVLAPLFKGTLQTAVEELADQTLSRQFVELDDFIYAIVEDRFYFIQNNFPAIKLMLNQILTNEDFRKEVISFFERQLEGFLLPVIEKFHVENKLKDVSYAELIELIFGTMIGYFGKVLFGLASPIKIEIEQSSQQLIRYLSVKN